MVSFTTADARLHTFKSESQKDKFIRCERKTKYIMKDALRMMKFKSKKGVFLRVYFCPDCRSFHLTKKNS